MSDKHTPGPWVSPDRPSDLSVWATKEGKTELIAETNINQWCKEAEAHANAKLIAASPDMISELKDNHEFLLRIYNSINTYGNAVNLDQIQTEMRYRIAKQLDIIAKATT